MEPFSCSPRGGANHKAQTHNNQKRWGRSMSAGSEQQPAQQDGQLTGSMSWQPRQRRFGRKLLRPLKAFDRVGDHNHLRAGR